MDNMKEFDNLVTNFLESTTGRESAVPVYESSLEDSFIYRTLNTSAGVTQTLVKYIKTSVALGKEYWEEQYFQINKGLISPLCKRVLEAYDRGDIELLYSREAKIGASMPFIIRKSNGKIVSSIFISSFATINKEDNLNLPTKQLYAILESAYIAYQMQTNPMKIQRNVGIMKVCSNIYVEMLLRIFNKEFALSLDPVLFDKVKYSITKFFVERVWEYPNVGLVDAYASQDLPNISELDLDLLKENYIDNQITSIDKLMTFIASLSPRLGSLNIRYFIERYVNTYHGGALIALDYLPYVFYVIINVLLSSFLISQVALNDIVKNTKGISKFYNELAKIV